MMQVRRADDRGHANHGWLDTHHTFSFAGYYDPEHMGFGPLRVINEDRVEGGAGFGAHPHRDMEIISYVVAGALAHRDSMGTGSVIKPGDVQLMSAGTGVVHSEFNASKTEGVHFLQIWIQPSQKGKPPGYQQREFPLAERQGRLRLVVSPDGADGSLVIAQDVRLYAGILATGDSVRHEIAQGRRAWAQVIRGSVEMNGERLTAGDGAGMTQAGDLVIEATTDTELLVFDLP